MSLGIFIACAFAAVWGLSRTATVITPATCPCEYGSRSCS